MSDALLPTVIVVAGATYVLSERAPAVSVIPPSTTFAPGGPTQYDPMGLRTQVPTGAAAKVDLLLQAGFAKFQQMSDSEKVVAANKLNEQLNINPPLTGREDWQQIASIAGGAGGSALCNAIPGIGSAAAATGLCAIAGSYLGVQLESWLEGSLDDVKNWIQDNIPGAVGGWLDDVSDWLSQLF